MKAISNDVPICDSKGLHSLRLLPHFDVLKAHLDSLEAQPLATFHKPPHLGDLSAGMEALEEACQMKCDSDRLTGMVNDWPQDWRIRVRVSYERMSAALWKVAREFDVRGYGLVLREKLTSKWCECGCSTDHLGEVCERTVREDESQRGSIVGQLKRKEWDGRGNGVLGWETEEEEDLWDMELDFGGVDPEEGGEEDTEASMTIAEAMEWRFLKAEREKELVSVLTICVLKL